MRWAWLIPIAGEKGERGKKWFLESPINPLSRALASAALAYYVY